MKKIREILKDKLISALGGVGFALFLAISAIPIIFPLIIIEVHPVLNLLFIAIMIFLPSTGNVFWIWGLVCAINREQDVWTIIYYISFVILFLPVITSIISTIIALLSSLFRR